MLHTVLGRSAVLFVALGLAALANASQVKPQAPKPPAQAPASVRFIDAPSTESPAARKKRLQQECQGRPNAGACLGHTR